jgi:hypothetical protein
VVGRSALSALRKRAVAKAISCIHRSFPYRLKLKF